MKTFFRILSLVLCLSLITLPFKASAHNHGGYSHDLIGLDKQNWMSGLSDDLTINEISIPGTGNSLSYGNYTDFTLTQAMDINAQLRSGIRFLDVTLKHTGDTTLTAYTGITSLGVDFTDLIKTVAKFLDAHREEVVLIKVSEHSSESGNFAYAIKRSLESKQLDGYIFDGNISSNPTLGQARGKIILLADYDGRKWKAIPYDQNSEIQDENNLNTNWDLYSKWMNVKEHLIETNRSHNKNTRYINYLTGSGGVFPYFVASGHSSSGTDAPRLSTGLTEPGFKDRYPDFPRINRFGIFSTIAFEGTNVLALDYILKEDIDFTGIVVADFPGSALIREIIELNFKENIGSGSTTISPSNPSNNDKPNNSNGGWGFTFKKV